MGKNKKKEYVLDAVLDEETYMAYKSGQAIDNNGLRSPKGSYWPKQPSYREKNHIKEQLKRAGADMAVGARKKPPLYGRALRPHAFASSMKRFTPSFRGKSIPG